MIDPLLVFSYQLNNKRRDYVSVTIISESYVYGVASVVLRAVSSAYQESSARGKCGAQFRRNAKEVYNVLLY